MFTFVFIGSIGGLLLLGAIVALIGRRRAQESKSTPSSATPIESEYGSALQALR
jgi:hypothetical protein